MFYLSDRQIERARLCAPAWKRATEQLACTFPSLALGGVHWRESEFAETSPVAGGPFQFDPGGVGADLLAKIDSALAQVARRVGETWQAGQPVPFVLWAALAAQELQSKVRFPIRRPDDSVDEDALADALWGYNGRGRRCVPALQPPDPPGLFVHRSWRYSSYVSNDPARGVRLRIHGTMPAPGNPSMRVEIDRDDPRPGALIICRELAQRGVSA